MELLMPLVVRFLALGMVPRASAIVTDGNPNDAKWLPPLSDYKFFVSLSDRGSCAGTIISSTHVLTAAHCLCKDGEVWTEPVSTILWDNSMQRSSRVFANPECMFSCEDDGPNSCDVAVIEYDTSIADAAWALPIYTWDDELTRTADIFGCGLTGDANNLDDDDSCSATDDQKFRRAQNVVTGNADGVLTYTMDNNGLALEGIAQDGDSGGPLTIERDGKRYLAGANSGTSESNPCDFGSVDQFARVYNHRHFIARVLRGDTELDAWGGASGGSLSLSAAAGAIFVGAVLLL